MKVRTSRLTIGIPQGPKDLFRYLQQGRCDPDLEDAETIAATIGIEHDRVAFQKPDRRICVQEAGAGDYSSLALPRMRRWTGCWECRAYRRPGAISRSRWSRSCLGRGGSSITSTAARPGPRPRCVQHPGCWTASCGIGRAQAAKLIEPSLRQQLRRYPAGPGRPRGPGDRPSTRFRNSDRIATSI